VSSARRRIGKGGRGRKERGEKMGKVERKR
jgi:hypothetical protein